MLYLIGLGLDKKDLSLKAIEAIKKCKKVYLETYTSVLPYSPKEIEKLIKKKIIEAGREQMENKADELLNAAKKENLAVLISGDPLSATTHIDMLIRARTEKIKTSVIHAPSVITAVAETGLQIYKFGKTASIPKFHPNYEPESFYDIILENQRINAHTLLLLDIGLSVNEALSYIKKISEKKQDSIMEKVFVVCSELGSGKGKIETGKINELSKKEFKLPACLVLPASLHFMEAEMLGIKP